MGFFILVILIPLISSSKSASRRVAHDSEQINETTLSIDPKVLCSQESERHLSKLYMKGETRFSDYRFDTENVTSSDVEFTDFGAIGGRRGRRKRVQIPAKPEYGKLFTMRALGKEKSGWRNLVVKCGVNKGKVATLTYEILAYAPTENAANAIQNTIPVQQTGTAIEIPRTAEMKEDRN